nr:MAG TPA: hypothetical protein [Caudoviricetes sp.]
MARRTLPMPYIATKIVTMAANNPSNTPNVMLNACIKYSIGPPILFITSKDI